MDTASAPIQYALERLSSSSVALKPEQATCIQHISEGKDVFLWLPKGYGKSLCYEVLPFIFDYQLNRDNSAVLVVSPLISLMMDQVHSLRKRSIDAAIISSGVKVSNIYNAHLVLQYVHGNTTLCWYKINASLPYFYMQG